MKIKSVLSVLIFAVVLAGTAFAADRPLLLQQPTLSRTQVVFAFGGDLWTAGRDGGEAIRLTPGVRIERDSMFSPDGSLVAFTGEYDGNVDVYVVPASGPALLSSALERKTRPLPAKGSVFACTHKPGTAKYENEGRGSA